MALLSRIESFYLSILRVIILAAATIALVIVVFGFVRSAPLLIQQLGGASQQQTTGGSLSEFVSEKRAEGIETAAAPPAAAQPETPQSIKEAVALLARYDKERLGVDLDVNGATRVLMERHDALPYEYQSAYGASLKRLMEQLVASKGSPLQMDQINELLNWHDQKFQSNIEAQAAKKVADNAAALQAMAVAAVALLVFLLIVFCFIFVKIERNLRLVQMVDRTPGAGGPSPASA